jgi:hypothetical protein
MDTGRNSGKIQDLYDELTCPYAFRCLSSNAVWAENLTPFATIDLIQCLFKSKDCSKRRHYGYTYMCDCPMMRAILEYRREVE